MLGGRGTRREVPRLAPFYLDPDGLGMTTQAKKLHQQVKSDTGSYSEENALVVRELRRTLRTVREAMRHPRIVALHVKRAVCQFAAKS